MGLTIIGMLLIIGISVPFMTISDPIKNNLRARLTPPGGEYWFGTDYLGRDIFSRVLWGIRISLTCGVLAVFFSALVGIMIGTLAGYFGRWIDQLFMRIVDIFLAFPLQLMAILVVAALGSSLANTVIAVSIATFPHFARIIRSEVLSIKSRDYVVSARALGCSNSRIILTDILPNALSAILVVATMRIGTAILVEAALSFLGLGPQPPTPAWGLMVAEGKDYLQNAYWTSLFPGLAIIISVLGFSLLGDGLRDILDPRLQKQR